MSKITDGQLNNPTGNTILREYYRQSTESGNFEK